MTASLSASGFAPTGPSGRPHDDAGRAHLDVTFARSGDLRSEAGEGSGRSCSTLATTRRSSSGASDGEVTSTIATPPANRSVSEPQAPAGAASTATVSSTGSPISSSAGIATTAEDSGAALHLARPTTSEPTSELQDPTTTDEKIVSDSAASLRALGRTARRSAAGADLEAGANPGAVCDRMEIVHAGLSAEPPILAPRTSTFFQSTTSGPSAASSAAGPTW